jgi:aminodeoxyfutalosine deaminase
MRKLAADFILTPSGNLVSRHTLIIQDGIVIDLVSDEKSDAEYFEGVLCPGFINAHCHLELSHFRNQITRGTGLPGFIKSILEIRPRLKKDIPHAVSAADRDMWEAGIVGVGDISNTSDTFECKKLSSIRYHTFIELFSLDPKRVITEFERGKKLYSELVWSQLQGSLTPHAPYTVNTELFELIREHHSTERRQVWGIHNQETPSEDELFQSGSGKMSEMFKEMHLDYSWFKPSGKSSFQTLVPHFPAESNLLFVHNTYTTSADLEFLQQTSFRDQSWFCLCPKANLYIENRVPDIELFRKYNCNLVIGTDSLASNDTLSVLEELKVIHEHFPSIPVEELLTWATREGAMLFGWGDLGTFKPKSSPSVLHLKGVDALKISPSATVHRIV